MLIQVNTTTVIPAKAGIQWIPASIRMADESEILRILSFQAAPQLAAITGSNSV